jgi:hypothetical protein
VIKVVVKVKFTHIRLAIALELSLAGIVELSVVFVKVCRFNYSPVFSRMIERTFETFEAF